MAVEIVLNPPSLSFSANNITAKLNCLNYLDQAGVKAVNIISFASIPSYDSVINIKYGSLNFNMVAKSGLDVDFTGFTYNNYDLSFILAGFKSNYFLSRDFDISLAGTDLVFTAKQYGPFYNFTSGGTNSISGVAEVVKQNYSVLFRLYLEKSDYSGYDVIYTTNLQLIPGSNGKVEAILGDKIHAAMSNDIRLSYPDQPSDSPLLCKKSCRKYYFEFAESFGETPVIKAVNKSDEYTVVHGGLSTIAEFKTSLLSLIKPSEPEFDRFLKQGSTTTAVRSNQPNYLYFLNTRAERSVKLVAKYYFTDETTHTQIHHEFTMGAMRKYGFNVRFDQIYDNYSPGKTVKYFEVYLLAGTDRISEKRTYYLDYTSRSQIRYFLFWSSFGSLDTRVCYGKGESEFELFNKSADRIHRGGENPKSGKSLTFNSSLKRRFKVATGWMTKSDILLNADFFISNLKYRYTNGLMLPIEISPGKVPELVDGTNLLAQQFEYQYHFDDHSYTEGDAEDTGINDIGFFFEPPITGIPFDVFQESDPTVPHWVKEITEADIARWNSSTPSIFDGYSKSEIQSFFNGSTSITGYNKANWDAAHSWGDHSSAGYVEAEGLAVKILIDEGIKVKSVGYLDLSEAQFILPSVPQTPGLGKASISIGNLSGIEDDPSSGTVVSIGISVPAGLDVSNSPITSSGTIGIVFQDGYSIPLTADTAKGVTAHSWGNHATAGYLSGEGTAVKILINEGIKIKSGGYLDLSEAQFILPSVPQTPGLGKAAISIGNLSGIGDDPSSGTVVSIGISVPLGMQVSNSPITSSGVIAITMAGGYAIPLAADTAKGVTAHGWGNHASAGYAIASALSNSATIIASTTHGAANTIVRRDANGYTNVSYINYSAGLESGTVSSMMAKIAGNGDYLYPVSKSQIRAFLEVPTNNNELTNGAGYITGINSSMVTTALGYTPVNKAGDVMSAGLTISANTSNTAFLDIVSPNRLQKWSYSVSESNYNLELRLENPVGGVVRYEYSMTNFGTSYTNFLIFDRGVVYANKVVPDTLIIPSSSPSLLSGESAMWIGNLSGVSTVYTGVDTFNGRYGAVTLTKLDVTTALEGDPLLKTGGTISGTGTVLNVISSSSTYTIGVGFDTVQGYIGALSGALYCYSTNGGNVYLNASSAWVAASDVNRKKDIEPYELGLDEILQLSPKKFRYKSQTFYERKSTGFIAQEVQPIIEAAYCENNDFIGLDYNAFIPVLVNAVKTLHARVIELEGGTS